VALWVIMLVVLSSQANIAKRVASVVYRASPIWKKQRVAASTSQARRYISLMEGKKGLGF